MTHFNFKAQIEKLDQHRTCVQVLQLSLFWAFCFSKGGE